MTLARDSIRVGLTLAVTGLVALLGALAAVGAYAWLRGNLEAELEAFARHEAQEVANVVAGASTLDPARLEALGLLLPEDGVLALAVWSLDGELVHALPDPDSPYAVPWPEGLAAARRGRTPITHVEPPPGGAKALRTARLVNFGRTPSWLVTATVSRERLHGTLARFRRYAAAGVAGATLLVFLGSFWMLGRALRPVHHLVHEAIVLSQEGQGRRLAEPSPGSELGELASLLNRMLAQTEETLARLRSFTAHASHELRTPLTRMRAEVESALASHDAGKAREALGAVLEELDEVRRVIDALLDLAQGDEPVLGKGPPLDLRGLLAEVVGEARAVGAEQGVRLELVASCPASVPGNRALLARVLWNLIDNAMRASGPGGRVQLALQRLADGRFAVDVEDDGPGFPQQGNPDTFFEPFVQGPEARASRRGHGLGLALSRAVARRHGGDLRPLSPGKLGGARLRLSLPGSPAA